MSETITRDYLPETVREAEFWDTRKLAAEIANQNGTQLNDPGDECTIAAWEHGEKGQVTDFALCEELEDGEVIYLLQVEAEASDDCRIFQFYKDLSGVVVWYGKDQNCIMYDFETPEGQQAEGELRKYLGTAPIDFQRIKLDSLWRTVFDEMVFEMVRQDKWLADLKQSNYQDDPKTFWEVVYALACKYEKNSVQMRNLVESELANSKGSNGEA